MDDAQVSGKNEHEHDSRLRKVLLRLQDAGVTLTAEKCEFANTRVKFWVRSWAHKAYLAILRRPWPKQEFLLQ